MAHHYRVNRTCSIRWAPHRRRINSRGGGIDGVSSSVLLWRNSHDIQRDPAFAFLSIEAPAVLRVVMDGAVGESQQSIDVDRATLTISTMIGVSPGIFCKAGISITSAAPRFLRILTGFGGGGRFSFSGVVSCEP